MVLSENHRGMSILQHKPFTFLGVGRLQEKDSSSRLHHSKDGHHQIKGTFQAQPHVFGTNPLVARVDWNNRLTGCRKNGHSRRPWQWSPTVDPRSCHTKEDGGKTEGFANLKAFQIFRNHSILGGVRGSIRKCDIQSEFNFLGKLSDGRVFENGAERKIKFQHLAETGDHACCQE